MEAPLKAKVLPFVLSRYESLRDDGRWIESHSSLPGAGNFVSLRAQPPSAQP